MVLRQSLDLPPQNSVMNLAGVSWCGHFYDARWFVVMVVVLVGVLLVGWLVLLLLLVLFFSFEFGNCKN